MRSRTYRNLKSSTGAIVVLVTYSPKLVNLMNKAEVV